MHEVVLFLETDLADGLTSGEARARLGRFGPNVLPRIARHGPVVQFLLQFHNPLVYVLLAAAAVTIAIGQLVDAAVILGVVVVNAVVGYVQERRAGQALEALGELVRTEAVVVRDGRQVRIDSREVVPGDIVVLEAGDRVPADVRLTTGTALRIDESALTGESEPVEKGDAELPADTELGDRANMAYSSTLVAAGNGRGLVVATGADTEIGLIHQLVGTAEGVATPLTRKLAAFSGWLTGVILALAAATLALGLLRGEDVAQMVTAAVALAVGAIPEGLPAAVTITLAIGVSRMARRHAIIRKLPAAETLGSTTVICTDKTGTLTQNRMTVQAVFSGGAVHGLNEADRVAVEPCLVAGVLCNNASVGPEASGRVVDVGDPTETALLVAARVGGVDARRWLAEHPRIAEVPFSADRRLMATLHAGAGGWTVYVKGAVEEVVPLCRSVRQPDGRTGPVAAAPIEEAAAAFGARALRVLAFATAEVAAGWSFDDAPLGDLPLTFLGLQAMADPPRPEAVRAVDACRRAGIEVKMITGDHSRTAQAVARQVGLARVPGDEASVMTGAEITRLPVEALADRIGGVDVFARVSAEQKLRIVEALQRAGHIVAMTGDGINDAPALKQADIGISMGRGGTEVAKEASDMILTDDDFASIEAAVEEGRGVFDNLTKFIAWTLPTNLGEGLVILTAVVLGLALPILPVQILWINMTTAVALGLMLAFEPAEPDIMTRPPRPPGQPILTRALITRIVLVGALMLAGSFGLFELALGAGASLDEARTVAVNAFVAMEVAYLFNCRALSRSVLSVGLLSNRPLLAGVGITILLQAAFTFVPVMNRAFQSAPPPAASWPAILAVAVATYLVVGLEKWLTARWPTGRRRTRGGRRSR